MRWQALVALLLIVVVPADAALSVQLSEHDFVASPDEPVRISAELEMPCEDVIREEAAGMAGKGSVGDDTPPALFQFYLRIGDAEGNWIRETLVAPAATAYGSKFVPEPSYVPDFEFCHANPRDSLHYDAVFQVLPSWSVAANTAAHATVRALLTNTGDRDVSGGLADEENVEIQAAPTVVALLDGGEWHPWVHPGQANQIHLSLRFASNFDVMVGLDEVGLEVDETCTRDPELAAHHPVNITAEPPFWVERGWVGPGLPSERYLLLLSIIPDAVDPDSTPACTHIEQEAGVRVIITPATDAVPETATVILDSTLTWTVYLPLPVPPLEAPDENWFDIDWNDVRGRPSSPVMAIPIVSGLLLAVFLATKVRRR